MCKVIQDEGRKLSSRWSFKDKLGNSSQGGASRKTVTGRELGQSVAGRRKGGSGLARDGRNHDGKSIKGPEEKGQELKNLQYGYNQGKNQGINLKSQVILLKA